jgi:hypothetical protein
VPPCVFLFLNFSALATISLEIFLAVRIFFTDALAQPRRGFVTLANTKEKPP